MPSPVYSAGTSGNLVNGVSVAKQTTIAAFLDLSSCVEGQVSCEMTAGSTAPSAATYFSACRIAHASNPTTINASASTGATSVTVASNTGLRAGQQVLIQQATGSKSGELVTITSVSSTTIGVSGTGTGGGTLYAYSSGDAFYPCDSVATAAIAPQAPGGGWSNNGDYSASIFLGTGYWAIAVNNSDSAQAVTVTASVDKVTGYV
jgi:hypothetical protein